MSEETPAGEPPVSSSASASAASTPPPRRWGRREVLTGLGLAGLAAVAVPAWRGRGPTAAAAPSTDPTPATSGSAPASTPVGSRPGGSPAPGQGSPSGPLGTSSPSSTASASMVPSTSGPARLELWQLPSQIRTQNMSYVLRSSTGAVIVVDGGSRFDAAYLAAHLKRLGGRVDAWFLSHPHNDHVGAIGRILTARGDISVQRVYATLPTLPWARAHESTRAGELADLLVAFDRSGRVVDEARLGDRLDIGSLHLDVLGVRNPELQVNSFNNSSLVLRVAGANRSVLFLGDLGPEGGRKLLAGPYADHLPTDTVQMAHHGQNGVTREVYAAIGPRTCLWPTPKWLWDNDSGAGPGSGPWATLETRRLMTELDVREHLIAWQGMGHLS